MNAEARTEREIAAALLRMLDKPPESRPFVIVEGTEARRFVQFCTLGTNAGMLVFDVPELHLSWTSFATACGSRTVNEVVDGAALLAVVVLRRMGIDAVRVVESDTTLPKGSQ